MDPLADGVRVLTGQGQAGVAVLGVRGASARARLRALFSGALPAAGGIAYGTLGDPAAPDAVVDEVLIVGPPVGRGSGGEAEPSFEVHLHGSPALVSEVKALLVDTSPVGLEGALVAVSVAVPVAGPDAGPVGEPIAGPAASRFALRALRAVPTCPSVTGARILLDQSEGAMALELDRVRGLAPDARAQALGQLALRGRRVERLFRETTIALVGPVNAGKSTLFNVLVGRAAASVSDEEGTTRDALMEHARLGPWPVRVIDTAGERDLSHAMARGDRRAIVESEGQRIARGVAAGADWVLRLTPADSIMAAPQRAGGVREGGAASSGADASFGPLAQWILTRCAERMGAAPGAWPTAGLSALENPEHARATVQALFEAALALPEAGALHVPGRAVPFDDRSIGALEAAMSLGSVDDARLDALIAEL